MLAERAVSQNPPHYILGVDPGLKGGFALFKQGKLKDFWAMPKPAPTLLQPLLEMVQDLPRSTEVVLERIQLRSRQSSAGNLTAAGNFHMIEACVQHAKLPLHRVHAAQWTSALGKEGTGKAWALDRARELAGRAIMHDGVADAMMIGAWGVLTIGYPYCTDDNLRNLMAVFPHSKI